MYFIKEWLFSVLEKYRGFVVLFFCLPASFLFDLALKVYFLQRHFSDKRSHDLKVRDIQANIREWNDLPREERKFMCTARPNWLSLSTTFFRKDQCHLISIPLYNILCIDESKLSVRVEPLVTVGDITRYLMPKNFVLAVHLEIAEATLGGLAMGVGMTTRSHKVGLFQETVLSYDVVLSDGSLVHVTGENEYSDLFKALPWSHGTLGFIVALELQIVPAKPFVHMNYIPIKGQEKYCSVIRELSGATNKDKITPDFLEATVFSKDEAVVLVGWFSNYTDRLRVNYINRWYKPWYYKHVETFIQKGNSEELIPLGQYLLRHNRSIFWVMESLIPFGNHELFRLLFGWLLPPKIAFLKFTTTPGVRELSFKKQVFQDIVLPLRKLEEQINVSDELFDLYPLLVYPCKILDKGPKSGQVPSPRKEFICPESNYAMFNDLGIYGVPGHVKKKREYNPVEAMRKMEAFTRDLGGVAFLYADIFMTRPEFDQMFDLSLYEEVRKKYMADGAFPHVYEKVKPEIDVLIGVKNKLTQK